MILYFYGDNFMMLMLSGKSQYFRIHVVESSLRLTSAASCEFVIMIYHKRSSQST